MSQRSKRFAERWGKRYIWLLEKGNATPPGKDVETDEQTRAIVHGVSVRAISIPTWSHGTWFYILDGIKGIWLMPFPQSFSKWNQVHGIGAKSIVAF